MPVDSNLRGTRERLLQTICFEGLGLALVAPLCSVLFGSRLDEALALLSSLSAVVMVWSMAFNWLFDRLEWEWLGRIASDRSIQLRLAHAVLFEATACLATCPLIAIWTGASWPEALCAELGLTLIYAAYGYCFHRVYDHVRPVRADLRT